MPRFLGTSRSSSIGIEIQAHEIRLLQLSKVKQQLMVENAALMALPQGAIIDGQILKFDAVCLTLQELVRNINSQEHHAIIALPTQCVISKRIQLTMPSKPDAEIANNLNHYFPSIKDELAYDYVMLGKMQTNALLVAARSEQLTTYVNVVEATGLKVNIVDVDVYALTRAIYFGIAKNNAAPTSALLFIETSIIQFIVVDQYEIILYQQFPNDHFQKVCSQLKCALQLVWSTHRHVKITQMSLSGKVSTDIAHDIQIELGIETFYVNPFMNMTLAPNIQQDILPEKMLVSCGLALRSAQLC